jgi:hypothetical protein
MPPRTNITSRCNCSTRTATPSEGGAQAYAYLQSLSPAAQNILLNRIFFGLVRDSGREHTGAAGGGNYELGFGGDTIDTAGTLNNAYSSYQRAYAAIGQLLNGISPSPYSSGSFLGGLSTVRTQAGGNITIMAPNSPPSFFPGYCNPPPRPVAPEPWIMIVLAEL